jgi:acetyl-CoA acyltransferase
MTRAPWVLPKPARPYPAGDITAVSTTLGWRLVNPNMPQEWTISLGECNEQLQEKFGVSRERQDEFAVRSHRLAAQAWEDGFYDALVTPVEGLSRDEGIRADSTVEKLAGLKPSFREDGVIHAGNASQISDGAAALLVTTPEKARELGLTPIVRYRAGAVSGADPIMMLTGPIPATEKLLARTGLPLADIGAYEVNEAFAPVPMAWAAELGGDVATVAERLNPLGGAIAVGHPLGASGAILMTRLVHHMRANGIRYGLQTMCEGGGTANATLVELLS